ncbi:MAG TPA: sodium/solute symporter, partial [Saprospiraceae bacterium]|nr:sodium/solute symporter [Saprospiraceae bacterium]
MTTFDYIVFAMYGALIVSLGLYMSRTKKGTEKTAEDYFLASKSLPWWAVGTSLIAANISAEQMIGMSGQGFGMGLAIASYEFMAAVALLVVAKYFLPIFLKKGLYTIPQFVEQRFSKDLKTILAIFWIALFTFVNLATVLLLGALAMDTIIGTGDGSLLLISMIGLAGVAIAYSVYGGLSAVAWTDVLQVGLLILGGLITNVLALQHVPPDASAITGIKHVLDTASDKFHMILPKGHPSYGDLPGIAVLVGGMWVANLYYWGFNQYIIQRALAAKSLPEAQRGLVFAGFLKLLIPLIVVVPGIVAWVMYSQPEGTAIIDGVRDSLTVNKPYAPNDNAFPWLIRSFVPAGLRGLVVAALAAAIVSSLASMMNSVSTIFTMDIYKEYFNKQSSERNSVNVGRITALVAIVIGIIMAVALQNSKGIFNVIQEYTGLVSPGILAIFMMGLFWKKASNKSALWAAVLSILFAFAFKLGKIMGALDDKGQIADGASGLEQFFGSLSQIPWMHQMGLTFLFTCGIIAAVSYAGGGKDDPKAIELGKGVFKTDAKYNIGAFTILLILAFIYAIFW